MPDKNPSVRMIKTLGKMRNTWEKWKHTGEKLKTWRKLKTGKIKSLAEIL
ncbi:hypothetical protein HYE11_03825 [Mycoplasmopsis bovis]|nr:hypothetical protein HYE11_03825 [Mycoplasmopsis bovis]